MKTQLYCMITMLALGFLGCKGDKTAQEGDMSEKETLAAPHMLLDPVPLLSVDDFLNELKADSDTLYMYNFWATWCKPCIKEMPFFVQLAEEMKNEKFKLVFVSIDKPSHLEKKVQRFVNKKQIKQPVWLLDVGKPNESIPRIDKSWDGTIPATLLVDNYNQTRLFYEREFSYDELKAIVLPLLPIKESVEEEGES